MSLREGRAFARPCLGSTRASRVGDRALAIANFIARVNHELTLGHFPSPSSLTLATLPSMSLIPPAPLTRMNTNYRCSGSRIGCAPKIGSIRLQRMRSHDQVFKPELARGDRNSGTCSHAAVRRRVVKDSAGCHSSRFHKSAHRAYLKPLLGSKPGKALRVLRATQSRP